MSQGNAGLSYVSHLETIDSPVTHIAEPGITPTHFYLSFCVLWGREPRPTLSYTPRTFAGAGAIPTLGVVILGAAKQKRITHAPWWNITSGGNQVGWGVSTVSP